MTVPDPSAPVPPSPPAAVPPPPPAAAPSPPLPPSTQPWAVPPPPAPAAMPAPHPSAASGAASAMSALSGTDSLVFGGAAILLVLGGLIFGELLGGGGVGLVGALAGEVLLFAWLARPAASRPVQFPTGTASVVVAALVVAIVILELADLIEVLRNFNLLTGQGIASLLSRLSHWVGAAMMALGVLAAWGPAPKAPTT